MPTAYKWHLCTPDSGKHLNTMQLKKMLAYLEDWGYDDSPVSICVLCILCILYVWKRGVRSCVYEGGWGEESWKVLSEWFPITSLIVFISIYWLYLFLICPVWRQCKNHSLSAEGALSLLRGLFPGSCWASFLNLSIRICSCCFWLKTNIKKCLISYKCKCQLTTGKMWQR